jgi:hypothetical protein
VVVERLSDAARTGRDEMSMVLSSATVSEARDTVAMMRRCSKLGLYLPVSSVAVGADALLEAFDLEGDRFGVGRRDGDVISSLLYWRV